MPNEQINSIFLRFTNYATEIFRALNLSISGITHLQESEGIAELVCNIVKKRGSEEELSKSIENHNKSKLLAEMANSEIENDFPVLHAHFLIGLWGAF